MPYTKPRLDSDNLPESLLAPLDHVSRKILWHFGEVVEPLTLARIKSYIAPTVAKMLDQAKVKPAKLVRLKQYQPRKQFIRAKYALTLPNSRFGAKLNKRLDKQEKQRIF